MDETGHDSNLSEFYHNYSALKQWTGGEIIDDIDRFSGAVGKLQLPPHADILEIGFGEGRFLDWGRRRGYNVEGVEILPEMVEHVRARGHIAHLCRLAELGVEGRRFDLLAAFDVVEHLSLSEILSLLESANRLLKANGQIVLQFPNACSPFSALYQRGDLTHKSALSRATFEQLSRIRGWTVAMSFNSRARSTHPLKQVRMWIAHAVRDWIEIVICFAYYGRRQPLDPNIIVILKRKEVSTEHLGSRANAAGTGL